MAHADPSVDIFGARNFQPVLCGSTARYRSARPSSIRSSRCSRRSSAAIRRLPVVTSTSNFVGDPHSHDLRQHQRRLVQYRESPTYYHLSRHRRPRVKSPNSALHQTPGHKCALYARRCSTASKNEIATSVPCFLIRSTAHSGIVIGAAIVTIV